APADSDRPRRGTSAPANGAPVPGDDARSSEGTGRGKGNPLPRLGMGKPQALGVEHHPRKIARRAFGVERVAEDRMAKLGHVDTELVTASGQREQAHARGP